MKRLDEIFARCEAATPGPWEARRNEILQTWQVITSKHDHISVYAFRSKEQAEFIAHARTDIPLLVEALKKAVEAFEEIKSEVGTSTRAWKLSTGCLIEIQKMLGSDAP